MVSRIVAYASSIKGRNQVSGMGERSLLACQNVLEMLHGNHSQFGRDKIRYQVQIRSITQILRNDLGGQLETNKSLQYNC